MKDDLSDTLNIFGINLFIMPEIITELTMLNKYIIASTSPHINALPGNKNATSNE
jgi:hypothetical protein